MRLLLVLLLLPHSVLCWCVLLVVIERCWQEAASIVCREGGCMPVGARQPSRRQARCEGGGGAMMVMALMGL
jgi:hypothetical protein